MKRIMIAGTASGCGKTSIVCAILQALTDLGKMVVSFKCGPDYIDPMFHSKIIGTKSRNLDGFFMDSKICCYLLEQNSKGADLSVIEGVMGYYDGLGMTEEASSYAMAKATGTPVVLVINCKGMSRSIQAQLSGYLNFVENSQIRGVIFNQLPASLYPAMKEYCEQQGIEAIGYFPKISGAELGSRHLGLITADEITDLKEKLSLLAEQAKKYLDLEKLMEIAGGAGPLKTEVPEPIQELLNRWKNKACEVELPYGMRNLRIAVARDLAFCFYYEDNLELLRKLGCTLVEFSPLKDTSLPKDCDGLILGGGYPELYGKELEENFSMRESIRQRIEQGLPVHAECGGFMYLHKSIQTQPSTLSRGRRQCNQRIAEGQFLPSQPSTLSRGRRQCSQEIVERQYLSSLDGEILQMVGVLDGTCEFTNKLQHFGYVTMKAKKKTFVCDKDEIMKAHEFHRSISTLDQDVFCCEKNGEMWISYIEYKNVIAGFPHLHYYANVDFVDRFLKACQGYHKMRELGNIPNPHILT